MAALDFQFIRGGVLLPQLGLWLDPQSRQTGLERVFVSHAHSDHTGRHREVILTEPTARLMQARIGGRRIEHVLRFGERREFAHGDTRFHLTLLAAGHILGSAMAFVEAGGESLLYTGDFKLRPGFTAEFCAPRRADLLIMETTFGRPKYIFPLAGDVLREVIRFCHEALDEGATPVLLAYSLGKSQELLRGLAGAGLPLRLHDKAHQLTGIYEQLGHQFPAFARFAEDTTGGQVVIGPPQLARSALLTKLGRVRTAILTGWALDSGCRFRAGTDAAFAFSDHADFNELIEFVRQVAPRRVFTLHGFAADFAQTLRRLGFDAQALSESEQLELALE